MSRIYMVAICTLEDKTNRLVKVKANNDYYALIGLMRDIAKEAATQNPSKAQVIKRLWKAEKQMLLDKYKTYDCLKNYLRMIGLIVSKPLIWKES